MLSSLLWSVVVGGVVVVVGVIVGVGGVLIVVVVVVVVIIVVVVVGGGVVVLVVVAAAVLPGTHAQAVVASIEKMDGDFVLVDSPSDMEKPVACKILSFIGKSATH